MTIPAHHLIACIISAKEGEPIHDKLREHYPELEPIWDALDAHVAQLDMELEIVFQKREWKSS